MFPKPNKLHSKTDQILAAHKTCANNHVVGKETAVAVPLPTCKASCIMECGVNGQGINIMSYFLEVLANPQEAWPKFEFPVVG
ncbi:hypothetical protein ACA910_010255 [Epithemia clementina (nom. ined.)]